jgi:hypothetical protein
VMMGTPSILQPALPISPFSDIVTNGRRVAQLLLRNDTFHLLGENSHDVLLDSDTGSVLSQATGLSPSSAVDGCYSSTFRYDRLPAILSPARVRMSQAWNRSSSPSARVPVTNSSTTTWSFP